MREILFRGRRCGSDEWLCGSHHVVKGIWHYIWPDDDSTNSVDWYEVDAETVGQYTGLMDKNGKKIFEGDIIRYQHDNDDCPFPNKDVKKRIGRVFFQSFRASFAVAEGRNGRDYINQDLFRYVQNGNRVEVIGNIFDNPELLKEGE